MNTSVSTVRCDSRPAQTTLSSVCILADDYGGGASDQSDVDSIRSFGFSRMRVEDDDHDDEIRHENQRAAAAIAFDVVGRRR